MPPFNIAQIGTPFRPPLPSYPLIERSASGPQALVIEGEPGIGKTTLWTAAVERALGDFIVLSARPGGGGAPGVRGARRPAGAGR